MANVYRLTRQSDYQKAGPTDLMEMLPAPGANPLFLQKSLLESLVYGIVHHEFIHLSGPTGTSKSSLLEAIWQVPANFHAICRGLGFKIKPLMVFPVEMAIFESPGELYQRRSIRNGTTYDEKSILVKALIGAHEKKSKCYPLVHLREMGRVFTSSVQGGLLNLMTQGEIVLPDGTRFSGEGIAWVSDSNYQAESDSVHTLVTFDDALKRRFTLQLTLDYLTAAQEIQVLEHILAKGGL